MRFLSATSLAALLLACPARAQAPGTAHTFHVISDNAGGFGGSLSDFDGFGISTATLGDLDGDGVVDLAVGAYYDDGGGVDRGALWILFLNPDGTVKSETEIGDGVGGFGGTLDDLDQFGISVASLGDLDGDGVVDLAVGAFADNDGGANRGAVWILFLNADGTVANQAKISDTQGAFGGALDNGDGFGQSVAALGDLDGDGLTELAVGAGWDDDGGTNAGAVWLLFLAADGSVKSERKISSWAGSFGGALDAFDLFGSCVAGLGDLDGDGVVDLAVGARQDDDGGFGRGAVWVLRLNADGTVKAHQKLSDVQGGFGGLLDDEDFFGSSLASLGDFDGDGVGDLCVGAGRDDDGGYDPGSVWILLLAEDGTVRHEQKISATQGGSIPLADEDRFGNSATFLGDLDGDGAGELAVGARNHDGGGVNRGAVWVLKLNRGLVADVDSISVATGGIQQLHLDAGIHNAGKVYFLVGSASGTAGIPVQSATLPLTYDGYLSYTLSHANSAPLVNSLALLNGIGQGVALVVLPAAASPALTGLELHHAFAVFEPGAFPEVVFASNAVGVSLVP